MFSYTDSKIQTDWFIKLDGVSISRPAISYKILHINSITHMAAIVISSLFSVGDLSCWL